MKTPNRIYVSIDLDAVSYNLENMKKNIHEDTKIIAVLKADGYGHPVTADRPVTTASSGSSNSGNCRPRSAEARPMRVRSLNT